MRSSWVAALSGFSRERLSTPPCDIGWDAFRHLFDDRQVVVRHGVPARNRIHEHGGSLAPPVERPEFAALRRKSRPVGTLDVDTRLEWCDLHPIARVQAVSLRFADPEITRVLHLVDKAVGRAELGVMLKVPVLVCAEPDVQFFAHDASENAHEQSTRT